MGRPPKNDIPVLLYAVEKNASTGTLLFWEESQGRVPRWLHHTIHAFVRGKYHRVRPASEFHPFLSECAQSGYTIYPPKRDASFTSYEPLDFVVLPDPNERRAQNP